MDPGSHPLEQKPWRQAEFISHHVLQEHLTSKLMCTREGEYGRGRTRTAGLTDVNPKYRDRVRDVILLVVESFNN
jgi:hypothetical protein